MAWHSANLPRYVEYIQSNRVPPSSQSSQAAKSVCILFLAYCRIIQYNTEYDMYSTYVHTLAFFVPLQSLGFATVGVKVTWTYAVLAPYLEVLGVFEIENMAPLYIQSAISPTPPPACCRNLLHCFSPFRILRPLGRSQGRFSMGERQCRDASSSVVLTGRTFRLLVCRYFCRLKFQEYSCVVPSATWQYR